MRTVPVNHSAGPLLEGREPFRLMSISFYVACGWGQVFKRPASKCFGRR
jgi:hypothetical protein